MHAKNGCEACAVSARPLHKYFYAMTATTECGHIVRQHLAFDPRLCREGFFPCEEKVIMIILSKPLLGGVGKIIF